MKWFYYDYMGRNNPVCEDIGSIEEIHENNGSSKCMLSLIKADGMLFGGATHPLITRFGHYFPLGVIHDDDAEFRRIPDGIRYGDELEISPYIIWEDAKNQSLQPVCTDPRVLYIAFQGWLIHPTASKEETEKWKHDIPTRAKAEKWLKERDLFYVCTPPDHVKRMIDELNEDGEKWRAEMHRLMPRAF